MNMAEKPLRRDAERNRRRIMEAASELFAERGLGVSLNTIAHHAEVGVGTVYRHFPDKEQLIDVLFHRRFQQLEELAAEVNQDPDAWRALTTFLERSMQIILEDRGFMEILQYPTSGLDRITYARDRIDPLNTAIVERARQQGLLRQDFTSTDVPLIQLALSSLNERTRDIEPMLYRRYLALFLDGMRTDRGPVSELPVAALSSRQTEGAMVRGRSLPDPAQHSR